MNRLGKRVERLEGGTACDEVFVLGHYPSGCEERAREIAEARARELGHELPVRMDGLQCSNRPGGEEDIFIWFIGTQRQLRAAYERLWDEASRQSA